jgi:hypothetical protein
LILKTEEYKTKFKKKSLASATSYSKSNTRLDVDEIMKINQKREKFQQKIRRLELQDKSYVDQREDANYKIK